jgi:hypothetical protein
MSFFSMSHSKREHNVSRGKHLFYEALSLLCALAFAVFAIVTIAAFYYGFPVWGIVSIVIALGFGYGSFSICR